MTPKTKTALRATAIIAVVAVYALVLVLFIRARNTVEPPPTVVVPTAPAPLPAGTGIDGAGVGAPLPVTGDTLPPGIEANSGVPSTDVQVETSDPGIGGETYVYSPAFKGYQRLNAGFYYPSGSLHGAWDIGVNRGTPVYAATSGYVASRSGSAVKNHPVGGQYAIPNSPSNWVLICSKSVVKYKKASLYYQHLSPGVKVKAGQKISGPTYAKNSKGHIIKDKNGNPKIKKYGTLLGYSGNTGNSTGDHLHLSSQTGCDPNGRYNYLNNPNSRIFAPSKFWKLPAQKKTVVVPSTPVTVGLPKPVKMPVTKVYGPDVSSYQGKVSWAKVKKIYGASFAFTKSTEGNWVDPRFNRNWKLIRKNGMTRGAYTYMRLADNPVKTADKFTSTIKRAGGIKKGDYLVLDAEDVYKSGNGCNSKCVVNWTMKFLNRVHNSTGQPKARILVYTGAWWWNGRAAGSSKPAKAGYRLWISSYSSKPGTVAGWKRWLFWQYTDHAKVSGIGHSDASRFNGTPARLKRISKK